MMTELFQTFMEILHSISHRFNLLIYALRYQTTSVDLRDMDMMAVSSA
jgi:hypothetical protein